MNFHIMTLFPEMVMNALSESITGRAITNGLISAEAVNIRDYANNKHKRRNPVRCITRHASLHHMTDNNKYHCDQFGDI